MNHEKRERTLECRIDRRKREIQRRYGARARARERERKRGGRVRRVGSVLFYGGLILRGSIARA